MIISFRVENWMSFRDSVAFSMVASRERQHGDRVSRVAKYPVRVLPIAAIYGGNASGKTNFIEALGFAQWLVVDGTKPDSSILVEPFLLNDAGAEAPSRFGFELLIDDTIYDFSFAVTRKTVLEEKLTLITGAREKVLYDRRGDDLQFDESLNKDDALKFAFKGTRENQLFLTNSVSQKVDNFRPVYDWFKDSLRLITPNSYLKSFEQFMNEDHPRHSAVSEMLSRLDTGIAHLGSENISIEHSPLPDFMRAEIREKLKENETVQLVLGDDRFVVTRKDGEMIAKKLVTYHLKSDDTKVKFDIRQESDGSRRVMDLLPAFFDIWRPNSKKVYVIDEVDRSLHTLLIRKLLEVYLESCSSKKRSQLLLTTHNVLLMDQELLRRDEMWVAERDTSGASTLLSFSEYKDIRYDKDIRKSYLQGRLGGIPRILLGGAMAESCPAEEGNGRRDAEEKNSQFS